MEARVTPWVNPEPPTEEALREQLVAQELKVYRWVNEPDDAYPSHTHSYQKIICVVEGTIKFELPTRQEAYNLKAGDRFELPSGIRHTAKVGPYGVTCLEAHVY